MGTKVFISWSGELSKRLAEALSNWLPKVIQGVKPYFTDQDIEKGARWHTEIARELNECMVGIICLTTDNLEKPWVLFEAGALSKSVEEEARVCPLLFGLKKSDVKGPLAMFQLTEFARDDFKHLLVTINGAMDHGKLDQRILEEAFEKRWDDIKVEMNEIMSTSASEGLRKRRSDRDILEEVLALCRLNAAQTNRLENATMTHKLGLSRAQLGQWFGQDLSDSDSDSDSLVNAMLLRCAADALTRNILAYSEVFGSKHHTQEDGSSDPLGSKAQREEPERSGKE